MESHTHYFLLDVINQSQLFTGSWLALDWLLACTDSCTLGKQQQLNIIYPELLKHGTQLEAEGGVACVSVSPGEIGVASVSVKRSESLYNDIMCIIYTSG